MAGPRTSLPKACVLLVEGQNDAHVVRHVLNRHESNLDFIIESRGGIDPLLASLGAELRTPGRQALGILVDANSNLLARWEALKVRLRAADIELTGHPGTGGTIISTTSAPRVGVWLMPDNNSSGESEDFVVQMVPAGDPVWRLAQSYIDTIPERERKFTRQKTMRAKLYAWLATREDPRRMGSAIGAHDLEVGGPLCQSFVTWLKELFAEPRSSR